jgi:hypothetical protein
MAFDSKSLLTALTLTKEGMREQSRKEVRRMSKSDFRKTAPKKWGDFDLHSNRLLILKEPG